LKLRALRVAAGWAMVAAIVWLSLTPAPPKIIDLEQGDKLGHFIAYGGVMFWFSKLYIKSRVRLAYAAAFIAMGIALEFIQGRLGYRTYEVHDMYADTLGVLLGWAAALILPKALPRTGTGTR
jgi:VanZ family protein